MHDCLNAFAILKSNNNQKDIKQILTRGLNFSNKGYTVAKFCPRKPSYCLGINVNEFVVNKRLIKQKDLREPKEPFVL